MVAMRVLEARAERRVGSSPTPRTKNSPMVRQVNGGWEGVMTLNITSDTPPA